MTVTTTPALSVDAAPRPAPILPGPVLSEAALPGPVLEALRTALYTWVVPVVVALLVLLQGGCDVGATPEPSVEPSVAPDDGGVDDDAGIALDIADALADIDGLTVEELAPSDDGTRLFALTLEMPEDHFVIDGRTFQQRLVLMHKDVARPMLAVHTGYGLFGDAEVWRDMWMEVAQLADTNQLVVEHRFFEESIVEPAAIADWTRLTVAQSAADTHRIYEVLSAVYGDKWIGTGGSKGGMTTLFHHRHYPEDFAGIVPYVAPLCFSLADERYPVFLDNNGPDDGTCRIKLRQLGIAVVERREEIADALVELDPAAAALERDMLVAAVASSASNVEWSFWQFRGNTDGCALLIDDDAPAESMAYELYYAGFDASYFGDTPPDNAFSPYGYQVQNELGGPDYGGRYLWQAFAAVDWSAFDRLPAAAAPPWGDAPAFRPEIMRDVDTWLKSDADRVLAIYGAFDPWTAGHIDLADDDTNLVLTAPAMHHGASIADLDDDDLSAAMLWLEDILEEPLSSPLMSTSTPRWNAEPQRWLAAQSRMRRLR